MLEVKDVVKVFEGNLDINEAAEDLRCDYGLVLRSVNGPRITAMVLSQGNEYLIAGCSNCDISVWEFPLCRFVLKLCGHSQYITALCLSSDSRVLFSSSADLTLCRWKFLEGDEADLLYTGTEILTKIELVESRELIVGCTATGNLVLFCLSRGCVQGVIKAHKEWIGCVLVLDKIFTGSQDGSIKVWSFNCEEISQICCKSGITCVESVNNGEIVAFGSYDSSVTFVSADSGGVIKQFFNGTRGILAIKHLSESYVAVASLGGFIKIWDWVQLTEVKSWNNYNCKVNQFVMRGQELLFGLCSTGEILCIKLAGFEVVYKAKAFESGIEQGVISNDGLFIVGYRKDEIALFNIISKKSDVFNGHTQELTSYKIAKNFDYLLTGSADRTVKVWKISERVQKASMMRHEKPVLEIIVSESAKKIISVSDDCICTWDLEEFRLVFYIKKYWRTRSYINFSKDMRFFIYFSEKFPENITVICLDGEPVQYLIPTTIQKIKTISLNNSKNYLTISTKSSFHIQSLKKILTN